MLGLAHRRLSNGHHDFMGEKVAVDDIQIRNRPKRAQVQLLTVCLVGITRAGRDKGSEVFDLDDLISGKQQVAEGEEV